MLSHPWTPSYITERCMGVHGSHSCFHHQQISPKQPRDCTESVRADLSAQFTLTGTDCRHSLFADSSFIFWALTTIYMSLNFISKFYYLILIIASNWKRYTIKPKVYDPYPYGYTPLRLSWHFLNLNGAKIFQKV